MKIALAREDDRFASRDLLAHICPLAGYLERRLNGLCARIHGQHHVVPKHRRDIPRERPEGRIVEGP